VFNGGLIDPVGHPGVVGPQRSHDRPRLGGRAVPIRRVTRVNRPISFTMALRHLVDAIHPGIGGIFGAGLSTHPPMRARRHNHSHPTVRPAAQRLQLAVDVRRHDAGGLELLSREADR